MDIIPYISSKILTKDTAFDKLPLNFRCLFQHSKFLWNIKYHYWVSHGQNRYVPGKIWKSRWIWLVGYRDNSNWCWHIFYLQVFSVRSFCTWGMTCVSGTKPSFSNWNKRVCTIIGRYLKTIQESHKNGNNPTIQPTIVHSNQSIVPVHIDWDYFPLGGLYSVTDVPRFRWNHDNRTGMNPQGPIVTTIS